MVEISDEAGRLMLERLQEALEGRPELRRRPIPPGLKLSIKQNRAHLSLSFPAQGDKVVSYEGRSVLIIAEKDMEKLSDARFLVRQSGEKAELSLERQQQQLG